MKLRLLPSIDLIVWHCSDLSWGTVEGIRRYHTKFNGWLDIGYHYVMHNGYRAHGAPYNEKDDGYIYQGRAFMPDGRLAQGSHAKGYNLRSIGFCWVGRTPSIRQVAAGANATKAMLQVYGLEPRHVVGHYELDSSKTCPNYDMEAFRRLLV